MANFKKYSYQQDPMIVFNCKEQLKPNTFEFTLNELIDNHIDLTAFYENYKNNASYHCVENARFRGMAAVLFGT